MSQIISKYPAGLLGLLGLQTFGVTPKDLADQVVPIVDLTDLYLAGTQTVINGNVNPLAAGPNAIASMLVPSGEVWHVWSIDCQAFVPAASSVQLATYVVIDGTTHMLTPQLVAAANETKVTVREGRIWLKAGAQIGVYASSLVGAAVVGASCALVTRLKA